MERKFYEVPEIQLICLPNDVLTAADGSTDVGEEYRDGWN